MPINFTLIDWLKTHYSLSGDAYNAVFIAFVILCMVVPYLLGSLNFAVIISKVFFHDDIRKYGSGNGGTTNMLRTFGKLPAAATMILDMSKGAVAVLFGALLLGWGDLEPIRDEATNRVVGLTGTMAGSYLAGLFAVLGHMFPCFHKFKGGKGVATTLIVILCVSWPTFLIIGPLFILLVLTTKMISFASVSCMAIFPFIISRVEPDKPEGFLISLLIGGLVIFMHRSNIKRIWNRTESKVSFKKTNKKPIDENTADASEQPEEK